GPPHVSRPNYTALVVVHELFHALGAVPKCAPHSTGTYHSTDPTDVMSATGIRRGAKIDPGHDDYFETGRSDCPDLARSPYVTKANYARLVLRPSGGGWIGRRGTLVSCNTGHSCRLEARFGERVTLTATAD